MFYFFKSAIGDIVTVWRNCISVIRVKVCDGDADDGLTYLGDHHHCVMGVAYIFLRIFNYREQISPRIIAILGLPPLKGVDVFAGK